MNCNTTHYRANSSSVPGDPTVERSPDVAEAIERLREAGYEMELTLRLEIGLRERDGEGEGFEPVEEDPARLELTDEDRRTLRNMRIRFDDAED